MVLFLTVPIVNQVALVPLTEIQSIIFDPDQETGEVVTKAGKAYDLHSFNYSIVIGQLAKVADLSCLSQEETTG